MKALLAALLAFVTLTPESFAAPSTADMVKMLKTIDERMASPGDYQAKVFLEEKNKSNKTTSEVVVYRRDKDKKLIILFTKPKTSAGQGFLRGDKNLWSYDPGSGKWTRRTESDAVAGQTRRRDFDSWALSVEYDPSYLGEQKLGAFKAHHIELKAKANIDVAFPIMRMWIDQKTGNPLKIENRAKSGKLLQSILYPKWAKAKSKQKKKEIYYYKEAHFFDEVEKGSTTTFKVLQVVLKPLDAGIFTKPWLESKSR